MSRAITIMSRTVLPLQQMTRQDLTRLAVGKLPRPRPFSFEGLNPPGKATAPVPDNNAVSVAIDSNLAGRQVPGQLHTGFISAPTPMTLIFRPSRPALCSTRIICWLTALFTGGELIRTAPMASPLVTCGNLRQAFHRRTLLPRT